MKDYIEEIQTRPGAMGTVIEFNKKRKEPACAFCKKPKSLAPLLIGESGKPNICSNCVAKCNTLLAEHGA